MQFPEECDFLGRAAKSTLSNSVRGSGKEPQNHRKRGQMSGNNLRLPKSYPRDTQGIPKGYPRDTQGIPKGYPRDTQGIPKGYPRDQHRSNTGAIPEQYRSRTLGPAAARASAPDRSAGRRWWPASQ